MPLLALRASLTLWTRRKAARKQLLTAAEQDLFEARASGEHPRQELVERVALREKQLIEAQRNVARRERQITKTLAGRVRRPYERVTMNVQNQSSRNGTRIGLIVLHSTESTNVPGDLDLKGVGSWFDNGSAQASAHVGVDAEGNSARYVGDGAKAWHVAAFNSKSLGIEQIGRAAQGSWPDAQLRKVAQYIAYWSLKYDIPIVESTGRGVCMHSELGAAGGGHHDPGGAYPLKRVLDLARSYSNNGW